MVVKKISQRILFAMLVGTTYTQTNSTISQQLTAELQTIASNGPIVGFSVAVVNEEGTLYENGFGSADKLANQNQIKL
tara:strand:- start:164 stop:397 length:234 start_codon:yes stop_codon:yes gene_type:complete